MSGFGFTSIACGLCHLADLASRIFRNMCETHCEQLVGLQTLVRLRSFRPSSGGTPVGAPCTESLPRIPYIRSTQGRPPLRIRYIWWSIDESLPCKVVTNRARSRCVVGTRWHAIFRVALKCYSIFEDALTASMSESGRHSSHGHPIDQTFGETSNNSMLTNLSQFLDMKRSHHVSPPRHRYRSGWRRLLSVGRVVFCSSSARKCRPRRVKRRTAVHSRSRWNSFHFRAWM